MGYLRERQEGAVLAALKECRLKGTTAPAIPDVLARTLISDRLADIDEFGGLQINERGQKHLQSLERRGLLRAKTRRRDR
jgi:hypothetical protein